MSKGLSRAARVALAHRLNPALWAEQVLGFKPLERRPVPELRAWLEAVGAENHPWLRDRLDRLGGEGASYQGEWLKALGIRGPRRMTYQTGNGVGKTAFLAVGVLWFMSNFPGAVCVTTAGTWQQVEEQLWREIRRWHGAGLPGAITKTKLDIAPDWYAIGLSTDKPERFEGAHGRYFMLIYDEAKAIGEEIFQSGRRMLQSSQDWWWLIASTPGNPAGAYWKATQADGWAHYSLSAYESMNVDLGFIEEQRRALGADSPMFRSQVCGEFFEFSLMALVTRAEASACEALCETGDDSDIGIGCDVAVGGGDRTCIRVLRGGNVIDRIDNETWGTQETAGALVNLLARYPRAMLAIDDTGVGRGVSDAVRAGGGDPVPVNFGASPPLWGRHCLRYRDAIYWQLAEGVKGRHLGGLRPTEITEVCAHEYSFTPTNKLQVAKKAEVRAALGKSPDESDALALAFHASRQAEKVRRIHADIDWLDGGGGSAIAAELREDEAIPLWDRDEIWLEAAV